MAHMNQEKKARLAPAIKAVLKKYKLSGTISVHHYSSLEVNIKKGPIDFIGNYNENQRDEDKTNSNHMTVNDYWINDNYSGVARDCLNELRKAMNAENYDRSDIMSDHFDVGYYIHINIGKWDKAYECTAKELA